MPFRHRVSADPLSTRIDAEVRERLEEAVDFACLEAMVAARRAHGLPAPARENAEDRQQFERTVLAFLQLLGRELGPEPTPGAPGRTTEGANDDPGRLLALQVTLAKTLPDYWQRFEALRAVWVRECVASGGDPRGLLARLFRRR